MQNITPQYFFYIKRKIINERMKTDFNYNSIQINAYYYTVTEASTGIDNIPPTNNAESANK